MLRIPMRGYEKPLAAISAESAVCYESPCGVMSRRDYRCIYKVIVLRIPMRGYEFLMKAASSTKLSVTNPHAGL